MTYITGFFKILITLLVGTYGIALEVDAVWTFVNVQVQAASAYEDERKANAQLLADLDAPIQMLRQDFRLRTERYEQIFIAKSTDLYKTARPISEFESFDYRKQGIQVFFVERKRDFPEGYRSLTRFRELGVPKHIRHDSDGRAIVSPNFRCYYKARQELVGYIWEGPSDDNRRYMTVMSLDDLDPNWKFSSSDYKSMLLELVAKQNCSFDLAVVDDSDSYIEASNHGDFWDVIRPDSIEYFIGEGEHTGKFESNHDTLFLTSNVCNCGKFTVISGISKEGVVHRDYRSAATRVFFGGGILALALLLLNWCRHPCKNEIERKKAKHQ